MLQPKLLNHHLRKTSTGNNVKIMSKTSTIPQNPTVEIYTNSETEEAKIN